MYLLTTLQPKTGCAHPTEQPPSCRSSRVSKISQAACLPPLPLLAGVRQLQVSEDYLCRRYCCLCSPVARFSLSSGTVVTTAQGYQHTWWLVELPFRTLDSERGRSTG